MADHKAGTHEVVGTFFDVNNLKSAIMDLVGAGFHRTQMGMLASTEAVERSLGDFYTRATQIDEAPDAPEVAFVARKVNDDTFRGLFGGLFFVGTTTLAGAIVASAAALGGAIAAVASGVAAVGIVGAAAGLAISKSDSDRLKEHLDEGHLLLFVRTADEARASRALEIFLRHCAYEPMVYAVAAPR